MSKKLLDVEAIKANIKIMAEGSDKKDLMELGEWFGEMLHKAEKAEMRRMEIKRNPYSEGNDYVVPDALAKEGFWLTVGKASINIKDGDDGVSVSIYALDGEMEEALGETWVTHGELEGEDT